MTAIEPPARRPPTAFDWVARLVGLVLLAGILTVAYWVPLNFTGPIGAAAVLAILTLFAANLGSRFLALRRRVEALEDAQAGTPGEAEGDSPPQK